MRKGFMSHILTVDRVCVVVRLNRSDTVVAPLLTHEVDTEATTYEGGQHHQCSNHQPHDRHRPINSI